MNQDKGEDAPRLPVEVREVVDRTARIEVIDRLETMDTTDDADFDRIARLAAGLFAAPLSMVGLLDRRRHWFKAKVGLEQSESPVELSFCAHAIASPQTSVMVVPDASLDPRFRDNPLVAGEPHLRFYAGAPIVVLGEPVGTLCVFDFAPRSAPDARMLSDLSAMAELAASLFVLKDHSRRGDIARAALVREEQRHALALRASSVASWVWDLRTGMLECDELLPRLFGIDQGSRFPAAAIFRAIDIRDIPETQAKLRAALDTGEDFSGEYRVRGVHPPRWLSGRGRVVERDAAGRPMLVFGVNFDITEQKSAEERQRLLLRELNHRVKNTLASVQALATQTVRHARDPREFVAAFGGRLQALGQAHNLLSDREWRGIGLRELIGLQVTPYVDAVADRIRLDGVDVLLSPDQAVAIGMILHELASNATQYGGLSNEDGGVDLTWSVEPGPEAAPLVRIEWREHGGPPVTPPDRTGFGSILIRRSLGKVIGSSVTHDYLSDGVRAVIVMPLAEPGE